MSVHIEVEQTDEVILVEGVPVHDCSLVRLGAEQLGRVEILQWAQSELQARLAAVAKYEDPRPLEDFLRAVQDKLMEVQNGNLDSADSGAGGSADSG